MTKAELLDLIKKRKQVSIRTIYSLAGVNPANEEDRRKVWQIGQNLAELHAKNWIDLEQHPDGRHCFAR